MLWEVKVLPKPALHRAATSKPTASEDKENVRLIPPPLTKWNDKKDDVDNEDFSVNPAAEEYYSVKNDILFYPKEAGGGQDLRNTFYMKRRRRPMVPSPTSCPMPDKQRSSERRDRLYLLYLQPWVLEASWAVPGIVPHITSLNEVSCSSKQTHLLFWGREEGV